MDFVRITLVLLVTTICFYGVETTTGCLSAVYKAECTANSKLANISCSVLPVNSSASQLSVNFTFFHEETNIKLRWKQYQKLNNNRYVPGFFDITFDLCDAFKNLDSLPKSHPMLVYGAHFNPQLMENVKRYAQPCPLVGRKQFNTLTKAKPLDGPLKLFPSADYRADFSMSNNKFPLVTLRLYSTSK